MFKTKKIGIIHTPYKKDENIPHQAYLSEKIGEIEVFDKYIEGLKDIEDFSHLILLYRFHKSTKEYIKKDGKFLETKNLLVNPFLDNNYHGIFSTRSPIRPNPIGISIVELLEKNKNILKVKGVDMVNKTPLLDIKPYIPRFDNRKNVKISDWLKNK